jgi:hypothetical protein
LPHLTEVQGDVMGLRERLTVWLAGQAIAVIHSADIAPARGVSSGGNITLLPGLPAAEEFATLVHEVAHLCGAEIYVALASDARKGTPFGVDKRHITFSSETAKELHNARVLAPDLSFVPFPTVSQAASAFAFISRSTSA